MKKTAIALLSVLAFSSAHAAEGRIEISQVCAENFGCASGDTAGFPITISQSGSYVLTSDLVVGNADTTAIEVSSGVKHVEIDLNGFSIQGPVTCTSTSCDSTGSGMGINSQADGTAIHNGAVMGVGGVGINTGSSQIKNLQVYSNGNTGISCISCTIEDVIVYNNGSAGITAISSVIKNAHIHDNQDYGLYSAGIKSVYSDSLIYGNDGGGTTNTGNVYNALSVYGNYCGANTNSLTICP